MKLSEFLHEMDHVNGTNFDLANVLKIEANNHILKLHDDALVELIRFTKYLIPKSVDWNDLSQIHLK